MPSQCLPTSPGYAHPAQPQLNHPFFLGGSSVSLLSAGAAAEGVGLRPANSSSSSRCLAVTLRGISTLQTHGIHYTKSAYASFCSFALTYP